MENNQSIKVLFVCMGNICRSPTAHGVFQSMVEEKGLSDEILVDSAGTHSYHIGNSPDSRSQSTALYRGVDLSGLRARQFEPDDFVEFDYLVAMDNANRSNMAALNPGDGKAELVMMLEYSESFKQSEVPDPYFGDDGFEQVYDMIVDACDGLLKHIRQRYGI